MDAFSRALRRLVGLRPETGPGVLADGLFDPDQRAASSLDVPDAQRVADLLRQVTVKDATISRLQEQLLSAPKATAADRHCPNCAGLERTVQLLRQERGELRGQLAAYRIEATRHQQLHPITNVEQLPS